MKEEVKKEVREVLAEIQGDLITFKEACIRLEQAFERVAKFEEKFEPKDGDFVAFPNGGLGIFERFLEFDEAYYHCFRNRLGGLTVEKNDNRCNYSQLRLATESEKQTLLDALAKDGKAWDAENKKVVKLRFRADHNQDYEFIRIKEQEGVAVVCSVVERGYSADFERWNKGNYYKPTQAQAVADRINAIFAENL